MQRIVRVVAVASACMATASGFVLNAPGPAMLSSRRISTGVSGIRRSTMLLGSPQKAGALTTLKSSGPAAANWEDWGQKEPFYETTTTAPRYQSQDWLLYFSTFLTSPVFWRIFSHLLANTLFAVLVWAAYTFWWPWLHGFCAGLSTVPHSLTAGALGLLLVFRTNSAYDRFWEARKLWGALVNTVRDVARIAHCHLTGYEREHFISCLACFPSLLLQHLQRLEPVYRPTLLSKTQLAAITGCLGNTDVDLLWKSRNRPFTLIKMMSAILRKSNTDIPELSRRYKGGSKGELLSPFETRMMQAALVSERQVAERGLTEFCNIMGACERIVKSSVPTSYSRHTSRFLSMWCFTLPFVLVHSLKWKMIPVVGIICWMLFIIEEIGHIIEDPFNIHLMIAGSGQEDELRIEASLGVLRGDTFERIPAAQPHLLENSGNFITSEDYDPAEFHDLYVKDVKP